MRYGGYGGLEVWIGYAVMWFGDADWDDVELRSPLSYPIGRSFNMKLVPCSRTSMIRMHKPFNTAGSLHCLDSVMVVMWATRDSGGGDVISRLMIKSFVKRFNDDRFTTMLNFFNLSICLEKLFRVVICITGAYDYPEIFPMGLVRSEGHIKYIWWHISKLPMV